LAFLYYDEDGKKISGGDFIIKPEGFIIPEDASRVHGITTERANKEGIALATVLQLFNSMINQAEVLVAHNMNFDEKIVGAEFLRLGMENPVPAKRKICTMESATNFCALSGPYGYKWPKLAELHEKLFQTGFEEAHNAANDINATAKCFWELKRIGIIPTLIPVKKTINELPEIAIEKPKIEAQEASVYKTTAEKANVVLPRPNIEWVDIPGGTFIMGSPEDEEGRGDDEAQHEVIISAFKMSKFAVTFEQYDSYCEVTGAAKPDDRGWGRGNRPVINVNWYDAKAFADWMSCRLPTEAEWEYACRSGTTTPFNIGNELNTWQAVWNYNCVHPGTFGINETLPVDSHPPNDWGLHDMHGNVSEWCNDNYAFYQIYNQANPIGPEEGNYKVIRGGNWRSYAHECRTASRANEFSGRRHYDIGFRLVFSEKSDKSKEIKNDIIELKQNKEESIITFGFVRRPKIEWIKIPAGSFIMGSPETELKRNKEETQHLVKLSNFIISKFPITFEQYDLFCESTGAEKPYKGVWGGGRRPVVNVTWFNANAFAKWMGCRLPTEAEWEYACRAGTTTAFNTGENLTTSQANYNGHGQFINNEWGEFREQTLPVGSFVPNPWGLQDMHGNVKEWCSDWHGDYPDMDLLNPSGPAIGSERICRGGDWKSSVQNCRSAFRGFTFPSFYNGSIGFRLVTNDNSDESKVLKKDTNVIPEKKANCNEASVVNKKLNIEWVSISAGVFTMGSSQDENDRNDNETQHQVKLSSFQMSKYAVTFEQYDLFCEACGAEKPNDEGWGRGKRPVINVRWYDAEAFAKWLDCRLPTESEWEYACRAGTSTPFNTGNKLTTNEANIKDNFTSEEDKLKNRTLPVGSFAPNEWGLYDMHGNVKEWCVDTYGSYPTKTKTNPIGSDDRFSVLKSLNICRGGSWSSSEKYCRSAFRHYDFDSRGSNNLGFRLVKVPITKEEKQIAMMECPHDWSEDCEKCIYCGKIREGQHDWSKNCNKCLNCNISREDKHEWKGFKCVKCGNNKTNIEWVTIPAGTYMMGSPKSEVHRNEKNEEQHQATVRAFKMSKYAVTFEQYDLFCEATGANKPYDECWGRNNRPVINVSWKDAKAFADWMGCRLPTEAEWEYACRAGTTTPFNTGMNLTTSHANYNGELPYNNNAIGENRIKTLPVGCFEPNALGLYDMHGNVSEWCSDSDSFFVWGSGNLVYYRHRGGSWKDDAIHCRSANSEGRLNVRDNWLGFRLVLDNNSKES
jgi:formylglycine-generating enzyme required for sulfatase activity